PANVPNPATVTLTATSVTDNTKSATATVTVVLGPLTVQSVPSAVRSPRLRRNSSPARPSTTRITLASLGRLTETTVETPPPARSALPGYLLRVPRQE